MKTPQDVIDFWMSDTARKRWFNSTSDFDADVTEQFEATSKALATDAELRSEWQATPQGSLALIIALDQFSRNMYRGEARAFDWDPISLSVAKHAVENGFDLELGQDRRAFVYMPFMHSEDLADQQRCVELARERLDDQSTAKHARQHMEVIALFGRFPHRNDTLGRTSTDAEIQFLENGGYDPS